MREVGGATTTADLRTTLDAGVARLGLTVPDGATARLLEFVALLCKWNAVYNLTSVRDPADMVAVHILDSLAILPVIDASGGQTIVDVGSGAGLPGLPIALARPDLTVHSIDAVAKKIGFQLHTRTALSLSNFHPVHARIESFSPAAPPAVIVSRAYAELAVMLASIEALAGPHTTVVAMKGTVPTAELAAVPAGWVVGDVRVLDVPFLGAERCTVTLRRVGAR